MNILLVFVALACLVFLLAACGGGKPAEPRDPPRDPVVTGKKDPGLPAGTLGKEELLRMLQNLASDPPPSALRPGAMCYEVAAGPARAEYVCPKCGEKTLYARDDGDRKADWGVIGNVASGIVACRRAAATVKGLKLELDESEFCRKCGPGTEDPDLWLVAEYGGAGGPVRTRSVTAEDIRLLAEFTSGAGAHRGDTDEESPLKDHLPRIRQLLGLKQR